MILHITTLAEWNQAQENGTFTDPSLETEGFIHCSYPEQVLTPANERFSGRDDLHLLVIDPEALEAKLVVEDSYGSGNEFPHIYGELNLDAVTKVVPFPRGEDGAFDSVPSI